MTASPPGGDVPGLQMPVRVRLRHPLLAHDRLERAALDHAARRLEVVEDRLEAGEALEAHHLLRQQRAVVAVHDVALPRQVAEALVERHAWRISAARIEREVGSWEGVTVHPHRFGGVEFRLGKRELGHLHEPLGRPAVHARIREMLVETGRAEPHRFGVTGWVSHELDDEVGRALQAQLRARAGRRERRKRASGEQLGEAVGADVAAADDHADPAACRRAPRAPLRCRPRRSARRRASAARTRTASPRRSARR